MLYYIVMQPAETDAIGFGGTAHRYTSGKISYY